MLSHLLETGDVHSAQNSVSERSSANDLMQPRARCLEPFHFKTLDILFDQSDVLRPAQNSVSERSSANDLMQPRARWLEPFHFNTHDILFDQSDVLRHAQNSVSERSSANDMVGPPGLEPGTNGL